MRNFVATLTIPVALLALACSGEGAGTGALPDDLKKDLDAASTASLELANRAGTNQTRFVSEIELAKSSTPVQMREEPKRVTRKNASPVGDTDRSPDPAPAQEVQVAEAPTETPQEESPAPEVSAVPMVTPRPLPMPVDYPSEGANRGRVGDGSGSGGGVDVGTVIGVIIRGGSIGRDGDHCPPPGRRGRRPLPLPRR